MKFSGEFNGYIWEQKYFYYEGDAYVLTKRRTDGLKTTAKNKFKEESDGTNKTNQTVSVL